MLTGKFRASYAYVFEPHVPQGGGDPKYSITMLIPKSDTATLNMIHAEMNRALQEGLSKDFNGQMPARPNMPLYDGDGPRPSGEPYGEECRGCMVMTASSKTKPSVVDLNVQPIIDPNAFYSGCYARATINFYTYNKNGNKGIGCGLNNIQKVEDGEPLSGRTTAEEDFGGRNAWNGPAAYHLPAQGAPGPGYGQAPYQAYTQQANPGFPPQQPYQAPMQQSYTASPEGYPQQGQYAQQSGTVPQGQLQTQIDPITGLPIIPGGVMGL